MDLRRKRVLNTTLKACVAYSLFEEFFPSVDRSYWTHELWTERDMKSEFLLAENLLSSDGDPEMCHRYFRMSKEQFHVLLDMVEEAITHQDTNFRKAVSPQRRLILTLRFLITGASQQDLSFSFRLGHTTVGTIIDECCRAIWKNLLPEVLVPPSTQKWLDIANEFSNIWQCPNCIGAMDGKHIRLRAPIGSGSEYYNYKGYFSLVLLAVCDAKYRFVLVSIGDSGRHSDGGVFSNSTMGRKFMSGSLAIPEPTYLPSTNRVRPYFFACDDAFPLKIGMLKPYPGQFLERSMRIFNYRLSRARRVVENAFGLLAVRFQIFYRPINCDIEKAKVIVQAAVVLHNYIQGYCETNINPTGIHGDTVDPDGSVVDGSWRSVLPRAVNLRPLDSFGSNNYTREANYYRNSLMQYFVTVGAVPWQ